MGRFFLKQLFFFMVLLLLQISGYAEDQYRVAVTRFRGSDLYIAQEHLLTSIPVHIMKEISHIPLHSLSKMEKSAWKARQRLEQKRKLQKELHSAQYKYDRAIIRQENAHTIETLKDKLQSLRSDLAGLEEGRENGELVPPGEVQLVLAGSNREGELLELPAIDLGIWAKKNTYDAVVWGEVERLEEMLYAEVKIFFSASEESQIVFRGSFFAHELESVISDSLVPLRDRLYGKAWADLAFDIVPQSAVVFVDGRRVPPDDAGMVRFLAPGIKSLRIAAEGYLSEEIQVDLENGRTEYVSVELKKKDPATVLLNTYPSNAEVFLDSVYLGRTPLLLEDTLSSSTITMEKEGYHSVFKAIGASSGQIDFRMHSEDVSLPQIVRRSRDRFYQGLAGFLFSLPLTVLTYGQSQQYAYAYNSALSNPSVPPGEKERLKVSSLLWYTSYLGSLFLNAVMFTDTVVSISKYIESSQQN